MLAIHFTDSLVLDIMHFHLSNLSGLKVYMLYHYTHIDCNFSVYTIIDIVHLFSRITLLSCVGLNGSSCLMYVVSCMSYIGILSYIGIYCEFSLFSAVNKI